MGKMRVLVLQDPQVLFTLGLFWVQLDLSAHVLGPGLGPIIRRVTLFLLFFLW